jgi:Pregnancy-associated plasma protein-A
MKQILSSLIVASLLVASCTKVNEPVDTNAAAEENISAPISNRTCASAEILSAQLAADPALKARRELLENFTSNFIKNGGNQAQGSITIPVVVNVLYNTAAENISLEQIQSQIDVLNEDFNKRNRDVGDVPSIYRTLVGDAGINFVLSAVVRRHSNRKSWAPVDGMKRSSAGGIDPTDPEHKLNMWSCNLGQNLLGYAYYPGTVSPSIDGVVILYSAFGSRDKYPAGTYINNYDLGRTATHEVGHWLNLVHIWGDDGGSCAGSDLVDDTPNQARENYQCPVFPSISCNNSGDMSMNYMDYTYDRCMYMFSKGQVTRGLAVLAPGGPRAPYVQ